MEKLIEVTCPKCNSTLWVDVESKSVVQHKKGEKIKSSFDDLLQKEKEKKEKADEKFISAQELEKAKKKKAEEFFNKNIGK